MEGVRLKNYQTSIKQILLCFIKCPEMGYLKTYLLQGYELLPKKCYPILQYPTPPVFLNGNAHLNRQSSVRFGDLVDPHLKIINIRILTKFQDSCSACKEIRYVL